MHTHNFNDNSLSNLDFIFCQLKKRIDTFLLKSHLVVRARAWNLSLYDGDVDHSFRWNRYTHYDHPEEVEMLRLKYL